MEQLQLEPEVVETKTDRLARIKKETEVWFLEQFWPTYPDDLCGGARNKGSRGLALKKAIQLAPDEQERNRILSALQAQIRHDRIARSNGYELSRWPYCVTYLNQRRYDDEIESTVEVMTKGGVHVQICAKDGCDNETQGAGVPFCNRCNEPLADPVMYQMRIDMLKELGLRKTKSESFHEFAVRCKDK